MLGYDDDNLYITEIPNHVSWKSCEPELQAVCRLLLNVLNPIYEIPEFNPIDTYFHLWMIVITLYPKEHPPKAY